MKNIKKGCSPQGLQHLRNICPCYILFYANLLKISICKIKKEVAPTLQIVKVMGMRLRAY